MEHIVARVVGCGETAGPLSLLDVPPEAWRELAVGESQAETHKEAETPQTSPEELRAQLGRVLDDNGWNLTRSLEYCERLL